MSKTKKKSLIKKKSKKKTNNSKVKVIYVKKILSDKDIESKEGHYFDESFYKKKNKKYLIDYDCDCYRIDENNKKHLLLKFRKNVLPENLCDIGIENLKKAAMKHHDNRGAAAGLLDYSKLPKYANDPNYFVKKSKFRVEGYVSKFTGKTVNNSLGNLSQSNIIGYFDRPDRNLGKNAPLCRTTAFTGQQAEKWKNVIPLIKSIDKQFKILVPDRYKAQYKRAQLTPFVIPNTSFSTLTINYNWRTALHKDAGDFKEGFGNLVVLEEPNKKYKGGYTGFPQYGVCVNVKNGDFLAMDVHEWHCNTKIISIDKDYTRLSLVAYLREKMIRCKDLKNN